MAELPVPVPGGVSDQRTRHFSISLKKMKVSLGNLGTFQPKRLRLINSANEASGNNAADVATNSAEDGASNWNGADGASHNRAEDGATGNIAED